MPRLRGTVMLFATLSFLPLGASAQTLASPAGPLVWVDASGVTVGSPARPFDVVIQLANGVASAWTTSLPDKTVGLQGTFSTRFISSDCTGLPYLNLSEALAINAGDLQLVVDASGDLYSYDLSQGASTITQGSTLYSYGCALNSGSFEAYALTLEASAFLDQFELPLHLEHR